RHNASAPWIARDGDWEFLRLSTWNAPCSGVDKTGSLRRRHYSVTSVFGIVGSFVRQLWSSLRGSSGPAAAELGKAGGASAFVGRGQCIRGRFRRAARAPAGVAALGRAVQDLRPHRPRRREQIALTV